MYKYLSTFYTMLKRVGVGGGDYYSNQYISVLFWISVNFKLLFAI